MPTIQEQEDLVELIKHGPQTYRISLSGYGGEMVFGTVTDEQGEYWKSRPADDFFGYIMDCDREENEEFADVPEDAKFDGEWYEQEDISHENGVTNDRISTHVTIEKLESDEYNANITETIFEGRYGELIDQFGLEFDDSQYTGTDYGDLQNNRTSRYVFYGMSVEKGNFSNFCFTHIGKIDWSLLRFTEEEFPNGDTFISNVHFVNPDGTLNTQIDIEDNGGDGSDGKGMYAEIWDLDDEQG